MRTSPPPGHGLGVRAIGRELGRSPSTISRELRRVQHRLAPTDRHRPVYRASTAQADADRRAGRPKQAKLAAGLPLRGEVQDRLVQNHSPEQIAYRLREDFPDDPEMWVSHETIYQSLYVQSRGGLSASWSNTCARVEPCGIRGGKPISAGSGSRGW